MPDAIQVLKPGWRAFDANGDILPGAVLHFFDAGTSNTRTVYSNYGLSTSLGVTVTTDAGGYPTSDGSSKVEIYTGNTAYRVKLLDADDNTIWDIDNIIGALDTSSFLTDASLVPVNPITNTSSNQSIGASDDGKYYNIDCSGGDVTVTLGNAATLGNGHTNVIRHDGTANQVLIVGSSSELFKIPGHAGVTAFALVNRGQTVRITCDATGFKVEETANALFNTVGLILIADRTNSPPATEAGQRYIVTSSPAGAWSSFAEHDIVEANGQSGWFKITPPTDCGWIAYVQDEDALYSFIGSAWVQNDSSDTIAGRMRRATQSDMETATAVDAAVLPGRIKYSPHAAKIWASWTAAGALQESVGVSSITDHGTGDFSVNFTTALATSTYAAMFSVVNNGSGSNAIPQVSTRSTTACRCNSVQAGVGNSENNLSAYCMAIFGDYT